MRRLRKNTRPQKRTENEFNTVTPKLGELLQHIPGTTQDLCPDDSNSTNN